MTSSRFRSDSSIYFVWSFDRLVFTLASLCFIAVAIMKSSCCSELHFIWNILTRCIVREAFEKET